MASKFSGRLGSFISSDEDTFANPFTSPKEQVEPEVHSRKSSRSDEDDEDYSRKRKKKSKLEKILENGEQIKTEQAEKTKQNKPKHQSRNK